MARVENRFQAFEDKDIQVVTSRKLWKVGTYTRISVDRNDKTESMDSQLAIIDNYISKHSDMKIVENYKDCGKTGTNFDRPGFQQMMEDIHKKKIDCIMVKDLSRLGRNQLAVSNLIYTMFPFLGVRFIAINDHYDTEDAENANKSLEVSIKNLVNDLYTKDISKRIAISRQQDMARGSFVGSYAPYGYQTQIANGIRGFVIDEEASIVVQEIFRLASEGVGLREMAAHLTEERFTIPGLYQKTKHLHIEAGDEDKKWHIGTLSNLLRNQAYIGNMVQNKSTKKLYANQPEKQNSKEVYMVVKDCHEAIISKELFAKIQKLNQERSETSTFGSDRGKKVKAKDNKYEGILFCGVCGKSIPQLSKITEVATDTTDKKKLSRKYYYYCTGRAGNNKPHIGGIRVTETLLDDLVMKSAQLQIEKFLKDKKPVLQIIEKAAKQRRVAFEKTVQKNRNKVIRLEYQESEDYGEYAIGNISNIEYENRQQASEAERSSLKELICSLEVQIKDINSRETKLRRWTKTFLNCRKAQKVTPEFLEQLIERIELHPQKELRITFKFQEDMDEILVVDKRAN